MKTSEKANLTDWDDHMDQKYGKPGTDTREQWEQEFEAFKLGVLLEEARKNSTLPRKSLLSGVVPTKPISPASRTMLPI